MFVAQRSYGRFARLNLRLELNDPEVIESDEDDEDDDNGDDGDD